MKINVAGMTDAIRIIGEHYEAKREKLSKAYIKIVRETGDELRAAAVLNLKKPAWKLSAAISSKQKLYHDGGFVFGMTGIARASKKKNDPGVYGGFHEQGYFISLDKVRKKNKKKIRKKRIALPDGRKKSVAYSYEQTKGRHFFRAAFKAIKPRFIQKVREANLEFEADIHNNIGSK